MNNVNSIILSALITAGIAATACAGPVDKITVTIDKAIDQTGEVRKPSKKPAKVQQEPSGDMDAHFIKSDEFFTSIRPIKGTTSDVQISKMLTPPSDATKGQGQFMDIFRGTEFWTSHYWKTRQATPEDLKIGKTILYWGRYAKDHVYFAPRDQKEARSVSWKYTKITDVSDLFKGEVTTVGNKRVSVYSIRVIE